MLNRKGDPAGHEAMLWKVRDVMRQLREVGAAVAELRQTLPVSLAPSVSAMPIAIDDILPAVQAVEALAPDLMATLLRLQGMHRAAAGAS